MRVLLVAENASKRLGGEAILPYHYFRLLRRRGVDVHLIVHERVRAELVESFPGDLAQLHFVKDQLLQKILYRLGRVLPRRIDEATLGLVNQMLTQLAERAVVRGLMRLDAVVHQPIPVSPRFPSLMRGFKAPVVIGPLNGGMEYPPAFHAEEGWVSRLAIAAGRSLTDGMNTIFAGKREAAVVLVANPRTRAALPSGLRGQVVELVENGVDTSEWQPASETDHVGRFVFIGRLVDWKALDVVLDALIGLPGARLEVIGDGPMLGAWRAHAEGIGVSDRVAFLGWRSQAECAVYLAGATALVLPSIYECGGAVVLEAMAMARPVIATAWGGPVDYLNEDCGILVEPAGREALVSGFARGMEQLMQSPELRARMGAAGRARLVREFDWERKIERMLGIYEEALGTKR